MTQTLENPAEISELVTQLSRARQAYYNRRGTAMTDHEYDKLEAKLKSLAPDHPFLKKVGEPVLVRTKSRHTIHMGSQNKANDERELHAWYRKCQDKAGRPTVSLIETPKLDGLSGAAYYVDGVLQKFVTRGDGEEGEDITANAVHFKGLPATLKEPKTGAVRGEVVLLVEDWKELDPDQESNPRNLAAGIAGRKDGEDADRLTFFAFDCDLGMNHVFKAGRLEQLQDLGVNTVPFTLCANFSDALLHCEAFAKRRVTLPYWADGLIFETNDLNAQKAMGIVSGCPCGQIAWKPVDEEHVTKMINYELSVKHTGRINPKAILHPVQIEGREIEAALLNNWEEIERLRVGEGDEVKVITANGIIPKVVGVSKKQWVPASWAKPGDYIEVESDRTPGTTICGIVTGVVLGEKQTADITLDGIRPVRPQFIHKLIPIPTQCPKCKGKVGKLKNVDDTDTANIFCLNIDCPAKAAGKIERWVRSLDIKEMGPKLRKALTDGTPQLVNNISDLYKLTAEQLAGLSVGAGTLGEKRAAKVIAELDKTRELTLAEFLGSIGVYYLGKRRVTLILEAGMSDNLFNWFTKGTGESYLRGRAKKMGIENVAERIQGELDGAYKEVERLLKHIKIVKDEPVAKTATGGKLSGKTFAFTGFRPDDELRGQIEAAGGTISEDLTKSCTHLVQKNPSKVSGKTKKATGWGQEVISEDKLREMLA
jgi:DNA ligase (NAD+)